MNSLQHAKTNISIEEGNEEKLIASSEPSTLKQFSDLFLGQTFNLNLHPLEPLTADFSAD